MIVRQTAESVIASPPLPSSSEVREEGVIAGRLMVRLFIGGR